MMDHPACNPDPDPDPITSTFGPHTSLAPPQPNSTTLSTYLHHKQTSLTILRQQLQSLSTTYHNAYITYASSQQHCPLAPPPSSTTCLPLRPRNTKPWTHTTSPHHRPPGHNPIGFPSSQPTPPNSTTASQRLAHFLQVQSTPSTHTVWRQKATQLFCPQPYLKRSPTIKQRHDRLGETPAQTTYVDAVD